WGVDAAGHDGQPAQVVRRGGEGRVEAGNARPGDHDGGIVEDAAAAVEDRPSADRDGRRLGEGESGKQGEYHGRPPGGCVGTRPTYAAVSTTATMIPARSCRRLRLLYCPLGVLVRLWY